MNINGYLFMKIHFAYSKPFNCKKNIFLLISDYGMSLYGTHAKFSLRKDFN